MFKEIYVKCFLSIIVFFGVQTVHAQSVTYSGISGSYISVSDFSSCTTPPCKNFNVGMATTGSFTTSAPLPANASGFSAASLLQSYNFSDGITTYSSADTDSRIQRFFVSTDAQGQIIDSQLVFQRWLTGDEPHGSTDKLAYLLVRNTGQAFFGLSCMGTETSLAGSADTCSLFTSSTTQSSAYFNFTWSATVGTNSQFITFDSAAPIGDNARVTSIYKVSGSSSSGLPVIYSIESTAISVCSIAGTIVTMNAAGTCVINANQVGNAAYAAAPQMQQSFTVTRNPQSISFSSTVPVGASATVGASPYIVSATTTAGLSPIIFAIDASANAVCSIAGAVVTMNTVGTCVINANHAGDSIYEAAPQAQQSFAVAAVPVVPANPTGIPTLSLWYLISMSAFLAFLGLKRARRLR